MATAEQFIVAARAELGTTEFPAGSNCQRYSSELGRPCQRWCADFVVWVARRVGLRLPSVSAYTPSMAGSFRAAGQWSASPQPGDLAFFDFPDSTDRIQHVGIVESATATTVTCIEGNTSPGTSGSQSNGGGVWRRTRPRSHVVGFGRPAFDPQEDDMTPEQAAEAIARLRAISEELSKLAIVVRDPNTGLGIDVDSLVAAVGRLETEVRDPVAGIGVQLDDLAAKVDGLAGGGVDLDVLAAKVADHLAARLAS